MENGGGNDSYFYHLAIAASPLIRIHSHLRLAHPKQIYRYSVYKAEVVLVVHQWWGNLLRQIRTFGFQGPQHGNCYFARHFTELFSLSDILICPRILFRCIILMARIVIAAVKIASRNSPPVEFGELFLRDLDL